MVHIAYLDDEPINFETLKFKIGDKFQLHCFLNSDEMFSYVDKHGCDLFLIDVHLASEDGVEVAKKIIQHPNFYQTPILFTSYDVSIQTVSRCLQEVGADFFSRSANSDEIIARLLNCIETRSGKVLKFGELELDMINMQARMKGSQIDLTLRELQILSFLLTRANKTVHKQFLFRHIWGEVNVADKTLNSHLTNLRSKIQSANVSLQVDREGYVKILHGKQKA